MKIFLYHHETGVFLGEDFADEAEIGRNGRVLPPGSTTIAPPPFNYGQVPVFNAEEHRWEIRPR